MRIGEITKLQAVMQNTRIENKQYPWPKLSINHFYLWTIIPGIIAVLTFVFPNILGKDLNFARYILIALGLCPFIIKGLIWIVLVISIAVQRFQNYPLIYQTILTLSSEYQALLQDYSQAVYNSSNSKIFNISKFEIINDQFYIFIKSTDKVKVSIGERVSAIDTKDFVILGIFEICEVRPTDFIAIGIKNVDPVWTGYIMSKNGSIDYIPNIKAVIMQEEK